MLSLIHISADFVLRDKPNVLTVYVDAPYDWRVEREMKPVSYTHLDVYKRQHPLIPLTHPPASGSRLQRPQIPCPSLPVSYTHLDVYKRQV